VKKITREGRQFHNSPPGAKLSSYATVDNTYLLAISFSYINRRCAP